MSGNHHISVAGIGDVTVGLFLKREDQLHPFMSGNKFRKLKYNLQQAISENRKVLVTFGGAYSNHISAVAAAGKEYGFKTVGIIRGEELASSYQDNPTLAFAARCGMHLKFISRKTYQQKASASYLTSLHQEFTEAYILPEGGTNALAVKGCAEILDAADAGFNYICTPVGTGGTMAGLIQAAAPNQTVIGYSALKGTFQTEVIQRHTNKTNFIIKDAYCFGGYAKIDSKLIRFMNTFMDETNIPLDPIYTAKMMFGIVQDIKAGRFPAKSRILAIHTGGLQGVAGMNQQLKKKNLPQIQY